MKVIYGKVQQLQCVDAIVGELPKLRSQAAATALVSMFAESGGMGAAATLAGVNGFPGYYIHFYIDNIEFYAAFTGVFFHEGEDVYVVYDEEVKENFNVLAVMNKNKNLLGMAVPFGHTVAMSDKAHNKTALIMGGVMAIGSCSIMPYFATNMHDIFESIYLYIYAIIFSFVLPLFIAYGIKKQFRGYAEESERIYKILGVTDLTVLEKTGMQAYIDPNNRMYDDVYNYTQFLDYDPQPLVDLRTDESHLR
ncbi:putative type VI secretion system effector [Acinetobacter venetianus]|uniref:putative type VI secretion system effector n=1 Tax=Acinetobacter venetianus TaxID=52133 RepID=UPI0010A69887|nr:putative type VI secretion system effector [Acinetobacter venetianus]MCR4531465.1 transposase [Acinetobacter venetianus]MDA1255892.1 transposase [Pseudomonadota bacterium]